MNTISCDVCIVGCGSGGIGAAIAAAEKGAKVVVIDKNQIPGGTVTMSWVLNWEPSCSNSSLTRRLWARMRSYPYGAAEMDITLSRLGADSKRHRGMAFEEWAYLRAVEEEFARFENLIFYRGIYFISSRRDGRKIISIIGRANGVTCEIKAKQFIDASADIVLAREAGCGWSIGADSRAEHNEPDAPEIANPANLNEVNWIFRVRPLGKRSAVEEIPFIRNFEHPALFKMPMPNGDIAINICGHGIFNPAQLTDYDQVFHNQWRTAYDKYRWYVLNNIHPEWSLTGFAPEIGIRESYRLKARYVLNENDIIAGYARQKHRNFAAIADHTLDVHGTGLSKKFQVAPYGIPYECLQTREYDNLLVACRGFGVSHIAAGSTRLSRTIMVLGETAGRAAALSALSGKNPADFEAANIAEFNTP